MSLDMFDNYETIGDKECRHPQVFPTIVNNTQTVYSAILTTPTSIAMSGISTRFLAAMP